MRIGFFVAFWLTLSFATPLMAHHGWGGYDVANPVTVEGKITTVKFENPHATITVETSEKTWTVILAPTSRMISRGASPELIAVGQPIAAYGYPSRSDEAEMRAERITVDGKTIELR